MKDSTSSDADRLPGPGPSMMGRPIRVSAEDELEFQLAMEAYKRRSGRNFPTWSEILEVLRSLGYAKRIWRPVGTWSPISTGAVGQGLDVEETSGILGWFSRVETPVGP